MKCIFTCIIAILFAVNSQAQTFQWAKRMGSITFDYGYSVTLDNSGNVYTTGYFTGTVDFDPGPGVMNLNSAGNLDIFIQKLDNAGNFIWAKRFGDTLNDYGYNIVADSIGHLYLSGTFEGTVDFDPGANVSNLSSAGSSDIYVLKLDTACNLIWGRKMGGTAPDFQKSFTADSAGNVYTTGYFTGTGDFNPGIGIFNMTSIGIYDIFISKLDSSGNFIWAKQMGGNGSDMALSILTDQAGNVYTTGTFDDIADFDPGGGIFNLTPAGGMDLFISKLNSNGDFVWAKRAGDAGDETARHIHLDQFGSLYLTGTFQGTVDFDPGPGNFNLLSSGGYDIFILKVDTASNFIWAKKMGGATSEFGFTITTDASGNVYTAGIFDGTCNFDPNGGVFNLTSAGNYDIFISSLDSAGFFMDAVRIGGTNYDHVACLVNEENDFYLTGYFRNTVDFDPGAPVFNLTAAGVGDIYILKLNGCINNMYSSFTVCDSIILNGITYTSSGIYTQVYTNINGCDSNLIFDLTVHPTMNVTTTMLVCDSITIGNQTYTSTGVYNQTLATVWGCDSNLTINLTVNYSTDTALNQTACGSYTLNGQTYTNSGTYTQMLVNAANCDSVLILNLTINTVNTAVTQAGAVLTAVAAPATYQWLRCNPYQTLPGAVNQSYTANANGDYAVAVTQNGCKDTSACYTVVGMGINEYLHSNILVYPNPVTQKLFIKSDNAFENASVKILNIAGQVLSEQYKISGKKWEVDMSKLVSGFYFVEIGDAGNKFLRIITKE